MCDEARRELSVNWDINLKQLPAEILGIDTVVEKYRDIILSDNVRIHLDYVKGLGTFIELEAVHGDDDSEDENIANHNKLCRLMEEFGISKADLITGSYKELCRTIGDDVSCNVPYTLITSVMPKSKHHRRSSQGQKKHIVILPIIVKFS